MLLPDKSPEFSGASGKCRNEPTLENAQGETAMTNLKELFIRLVQEDSGQDLIEYALVAALIALGALVGMKTLANDIGDAFNTVGNTLTSAAA